MLLLNEQTGAKPSTVAVQANHFELITSWGTKVPQNTKRWLKKYGATHRIISKAEIDRLCEVRRQTSSQNMENSAADAVTSQPLRPCQQA